MRTVESTPNNVQLVGGSGLAAFILERTEAAFRSCLTRPASFAAIVWVAAYRYMLPFNISSNRLKSGSNATNLSSVRFAT